ncbi:hypothetical protein FQN54_008934 [Arachnomyces sp. PD_36]|nr:hypothetical protein FQN54_008934 [Arachnomyces sp. PD_36]
MHLDHKIPWNTIASHFKFIRNNPHRIEHRTDLTPRDKDTQANDLNHFTRVLASTIRDFAKTERAKYPAKIDPEFPTEPDKLFDDSLLEYWEEGDHKSPGSFDPFPLHKDHQSLKHWIDSATSSSSTTTGPSTPPKYTTTHGPLADAIKALLSTPLPNTIPPLLRLSQHPSIPLSTLNNLGWGHSFGLDHVAFLALEAYILFNVFDAINTNNLLPHSKTKTPLPLPELYSYRTFLHNALVQWDFPGQKLPHRRFWKGVLGEGFLDRCEPAEDLNPLETNREEVRGYMKMCFEIMYRYDMLMRECEVAFHWEDEIPVCVNRLWGARVRGEDGGDAYNYFFI